MDFEDSPDQERFRFEVRTWLAANARPAPRRDAPDGMYTSLGEEALPEAKRFQRLLADARLAAITWPVEYGGRGGSALEAVIFDEEAAPYEVPTSIFMCGTGLVGPTLIAHGTEEQKQRFLGPMLRGDEVWCQLFSEPGAGSDLAGMRTGARRDGDDWVVSGQKVWNSGAAYADWGILPARTDPGQPKHRGLTYFLLDMATSGVTVRPLRQITGDAHFCEVFLDDVRIPAANVVGEVNGGWAMVQTTLMNERVAIGGTDLGIDPQWVIELARGRHRGDTIASADPVIRQRIVDLYVRERIMQYLRYRIITALGRGEVPGPEGSIMKLAMGQLYRRAGDLSLDLLGPAGALLDASAEDTAWQLTFLTAPSMRIAGGTDEIQRNIVSERVLGLPREPDPHRSQPFGSTDRSV